MLWNRCSSSFWRRSINNGIYKGGGTYENQNTFKDTLNTQKEKSKFIVEPNEYYSYNGAIITCSNDQITSEYDKGDLIFTNYSAIDEDIECTVTFQEENYEIKIETDNHGTIEGIKDNKIKQKHSDIKKYNKGFINVTFI